MNPADELICPRCGGLGTITDVGQCAARFAAKNRRCSMPSIGQERATEMAEIRRRDNDRYGWKKPEISPDRLRAYCTTHAHMLLRGHTITDYTGQGRRKRAT